MHGPRCCPTDRLTAGGTARDGTPICPARRGGGDGNEMMDACGPASLSSVLVGCNSPAPTQPTGLVLAWGGMYRCHGLSSSLSRTRHVMTDELSLSQISIRSNQAPVHQRDGGNEARPAGIYIYTTASASFKQASSRRTALIMR